MNFVALDFETANPHRSSVCAVGIAKVVEGRVAQRRAWLVRPHDLRFDPFHVSIHGITPADVKDSPLFSELWPTIRDYFRDNCVIAHNASFDMSVLRYALDEYGLPHPEMHYHCSVILARRTWLGLPNYRLNTLADHLNIRHVHHDAEDDAATAAEIVLQAARFHSAFSVDDLCVRTQTTPGLLYPGGWVAPNSGGLNCEFRSGQGRNNYLGGNRV